MEHRPGDRSLVVAALLSGAAAADAALGWVVLVLGLLWLVHRGRHGAWVASVGLAGVSAALHGLVAVADPTAPLVLSARSPAVLALLAGAAALVLCTPDVRRLVGAEGACPDR